MFWILLWYLNSDIKGWQNLCMCGCHQQFHWSEWNVWKLFSRIMFFQITIGKQKSPFTAKFKAVLSMSPIAPDLAYLKQQTLYLSFHRSETWVQFSSVPPGQGPCGCQGRCWLGCSLIRSLLWGTLLQNSFGPFLVWTDFRAWQLASPRIRKA